MGGYNDWVKQRAIELKAEQQEFETKVVPKDQESKRDEAQVSKVSSSQSGKTSKVISKPKKLNNKERELLKKLPSMIEEFEELQESLQNQMLEPDFYKKPSNQVKLVQERLKEVVQKTESAYETWEDLEARSS